MFLTLHNSSPTFHKTQDTNKYDVWFTQIILQQFGFYVIHSLKPSDFNTLKLWNVLRFVAGFLIKLLKDWQCCEHISEKTIINANL